MHCKHLLLILGIPLLSLPAIAAPEGKIFKALNGDIFVYGLPPGQSITIGTEWATRKVNPDVCGTLTIRASTKYPLATVKVNGNDFNPASLPLYQSNMGCDTSTRQVKQPRPAHKVKIGESLTDIVIPGMPYTRHTIYYPDRLLGRSAKVNACGFSQLKVRPRQPFPEFMRLPIVGGGTARFTTATLPEFPQIICKKGALLIPPGFPPPLAQGIADSPNNDTIEDLGFGGGGNLGGSGSVGGTGGTTGGTGGGSIGGTGGSPSPSPSPSPSVCSSNCTTQTQPATGWHPNEPTIRIGDHSVTSKNGMDLSGFDGKGLTGPFTYSLIGNSNSTIITNVSLDATTGEFGITYNPPAVTTATTVNLTFRATDSLGFYFDSIYPFNFGRQNQFRSTMVNNNDACRTTYFNFTATHGYIVENSGITTARACNGQNVWYIKIYSADGVSGLYENGKYRLMYGTWGPPTIVPLD